MSTWIRHEQNPKFIGTPLLSSLYGLVNVVCVLNNPQTWIITAHTEPWVYCENSPVWTTRSEFMSIVWIVFIYLNQSINLYLACSLWLVNFLQEICVGRSGNFVCAATWYTGIYRAINLKLSPCCHAWTISFMLTLCHFHLAEIKDPILSGPCAARILILVAQGPLQWLSRCLQGLPNISPWGSHHI